MKVPPKDTAYGHVNIPFLKKEQEPTFAVQQNTDSHVNTENVPVPGTDDTKEISEGSTAGAEPVTPPGLKTKPGQPAGASPAIAKTGPPAAAGGRNTQSRSGASGEVPNLEGSGMPGIEPDRMVVNPNPNAQPQGVSSAGIRPGALGLPAQSANSGAGRYSRAPYIQAPFNGFGEVPW